MFAGRLTLLFLASIGAQAAGATVMSQAPVIPPDTELRARTTSLSFGVGEPVLVDLRLTNWTLKPADIDFGRDGVGNLRVTIRAPGGRTSEIRLHKGGLREGGERHLAANSSETVPVILNTWYDFREIGYYAVDVALTPEFGLQPPKPPTAHLAVSIGPRNEARLREEAKNFADQAISGTGVRGRMAGAQGLSYVTDPVAIPEMARVLASGSDAGAPLIEALGRLGGPAALETLEAAQHNRDPMTRLVAGRVLQAVRSGKQVTSDNMD